MTDALSLIRSRVGELQAERDRLKEANALLLSEQAKLRQRLASTRSRERRIRRAAGLPRNRPRRCVKCGIDLNLLTPGCRNCYYRHRERGKKAA